MKPLMYMRKRSSVTGVKATKVAGCTKIVKSVGSAYDASGNRTPNPT